MVVFDLVIFQSEQFLIPFLFVLAIVFGALNITNIFRNRGVNLVVSIALAFFGASNEFLVSLLWNNFGSITIFFIAMFFIIFILEAFGIRKGKAEKQDGSDALVINGVILFLLLSIGYLYIDIFPSVPLLGGGQNLLLFIFIMFIVVIFWSAYKTTTPPRS